MSDIPHHMLQVRTLIAQRFIAGSGIEIGALYSPLQVGPEIQMKYVDRLPIAKLREQYPELRDREFVEPDIIDDGEILSSVPDNSLDFIIANHMLEHCENPLGTIRHHLRKIRLGGILYYAIPEKTQGFDAARGITSFIHLVEDDLWGPEVSRLRHFWEWVTFVTQARDLQEAAAQVEGMKKRNHSVIILASMVAVAATAGSTPIAIYRVVMAASGIPTSKGIPIGMDFTAKTMAAVMRIILHETGYPND